MRTATPFVLLLIGICGLIACGQQSVEASEFMQWVRDPAHGLVSRVERNGFIIDAQFKPAEFLLINEHRRDQSGLTDTAIADWKRSQEGSYHFTLRLASAKGAPFLNEGLHSNEEYYQRIRYYTELVDQDLQLVINRDTIPCAVSLFERTYGAAPFDNLVFSFVTDRPFGSTDIQLIYDDHALGLGPLRFDFLKEDLLELPMLQRS
jgi:hypothetical protein